jgi:hypothetical protein
MDHEEFYQHHRERITPLRWIRVIEDWEHLGWLLQPEYQMHPVVNQIVHRAKVGDVTPVGALLYLVMWFFVENLELKTKIRDLESRER